MSAIKTETIVIGAGVLVAGLVLMNILPKLVKGAGGLVSGNNALTQNAKNADGSAQTAYQGAGIPGTLGAATNLATGGVLSSIGDWLGGGLYDAFHGDPMSMPIAPPSTAAAIDKYTQGGNAASGSGSIDTFTDPMTGFGSQWGG
jgi:hypothetical protein